MKKVPVKSLLSVLLFVLTLGQVRAALPVVRDGKAQAVIMVEGGEGSQVRELAAEELQEHVRAMSGVELPVERWKPGSGEVSSDGRTQIWLGGGPLAKEAGLEVSTLPAEGYVIRALPEKNAVILAGRDKGNPLGKGSPQNQAQEFGTLYAAYDLLERWGVRWLFPGELGTEIPQRANLAVEVETVRGAPAFAMRNLWLNWMPPEGGPVSIRHYAASRPDDAELARLSREATLWALRNRAGNSNDEYATRHHSPSWWELWSESHPEFLGLYRGQRGWRRNPPGSEPDKILERSKLNTANDEAAAAVADLAIAAFEKSPGLRSYSICEQDGSGGFDESAEGRAQDAGEKIQQGLIVPGGLPTAFGAPSLGDRYAQFWNKVAARVAERFPDRFLGVYAYAIYRDAPVREKLHPNLHVVYCNNNDPDAELLFQRLEKWNALSRDPVALYYPAVPGCWGANVSGIPWVSLDAMRQGLRKCRELEVPGFRTQTLFSLNNSVASGLMQYASARWYWDPEVPADDLLKDFTRHAYGAAAGTMGKFYRAVEKRQNQFPLPSRTALRPGDWSGAVLHHRDVYEANFVAELEGLLAQAASEAETPRHRERVALMQRQVAFAGAQVESLRQWMAFSEGKGSVEQLQSATEKLETTAAALGAYRPGSIRLTGDRSQVAAGLADRIPASRLVAPEGWEMRPDPFQEGEKEGWASGQDGGEGWRAVDLKAGYDYQGLHGTDCVVWYRKKIDVPADWKGRKAALALRVRNSSGEVFLNGKRLGMQVLDEGVEGEQPRIFSAEEAWNPDRPNVIAWKVWGYTDRGVTFDPVWMLAP